MTLSESLADARQRLEAADIENASAESEWIAAHVLDVERTDLHTDPARPVTDAQQRRISEAVDRRCSRVPLQYILGDVPFCDCTIRVTPDVLIPRPETEWIVETILKTLASDVSSVLDIGSGSGAIAVSVAARTPTARVTAVDVSSAAIRVATANAAHNGVSDRTRFLRADMRHLPLAPGAFDLVVSNPPYIRSVDLPGLDPEVRDHEPMLALDGGPDGLDFYRALAEQCALLLSPGGCLALELPGHPPEPIARLFKTSSWGSVIIEDDWAGKPRLLIAQNQT